MVDFEARSANGSLPRDDAPGDREPLAHLLPRVYEDLRRLANERLVGGRLDLTLQGTEIVHEAFLRLHAQRKVAWKSESQFVAVAARMMRRVFLDHLRKRGAQKRGGDRFRVTFSESAAVTTGGEVDLEALEAALVRLEVRRARPARVAELRLFTGLSIGAIAEALRVSPSTVEKEWKFARAWLARALERAEERA